MGVFQGMSPKELRKTLKIPKDFEVKFLMGVPIERIPRRYLLVFLEGAIYEGRQMRKTLLDAYELGDQLLDEEGRLKEAEDAPTEEKPSE